MGPKKDTARPLSTQTLFNEIFLILEYGVLSLMLCFFFSFIFMQKYMTGFARQHSLLAPNMLIVFFLHFTGQGSYLANTLFWHSRVMLWYKSNFKYNTFLPSNILQYLISHVCHIRILALSFLHKNVTPIPRRFASWWDACAISSDLP